MVAFSVLGDVLKPKAFAGLFSAAPSVALTSLGLTAYVMGPAKAAQAATSMIAGAIGMIAFCAVAALLEKRVGALVGSTVAWLSWAITAGLLFWVFLQ